LKSALRKAEIFGRRDDFGTPKDGLLRSLDRPQKTMAYPTDQQALPEAHDIVN
jgi:hypothetical protein